MVIPLVEFGNRHSSRASALSYRHIFAACFLILDSFCLRPLVLSNFQFE